MSAQQSRFVRTLVDEFVRSGIEHAVIAPGSRSTPLVMALAERMTVHVFHDERSAAFFALGLGRGTGMPAVLVSTSGTAVANFHPAVVEADASNVPVVVCTADRPPELIDTGANQAIDQHRIYGGAVRWFFDPGVAGDFHEAERFWRSLACRALAESTGWPPGPVHLNLPFREPLLLDDQEAAVLGGRRGAVPWTTARRTTGVPDLSEVIEAVRSYDQGIVIVGQSPGVSAETLLRFATAAGCPVLADPLSGLRVEGTISTYDALLRSEEWAAHHYPYPVIRVGRPPTSKLLGEWTRHVDPQFVVTPELTWEDPHRSVNIHIVGSPEAILLEATDRLSEIPAVADRRSEWLTAWSTSDAKARAVVDGFCDDADVHFEGAVARDVAAVVPQEALLFVGSSMPVRDLETFAAPPVTGLIGANRGASGIDGTVGTALGMATGLGVPVVCLLGDIAFLHDSNSLIGLADRGLEATFVVVDNDGGGIFHFLPQVNHRDFERLFATPHGVDTAAVAEAFGLEVERPAPGGVGDAVAESMRRGGSRVLIVPTERADNAARHRAVMAAVSEAIWP
jgi:2-succinyl-5-enolpyruvyl-6-hydroxy-3-cyclohexene-1-carboxylate synthase